MAKQSKHSGSVEECQHLLEDLVDQITWDKSIRFLSSFDFNSEAVFMPFLVYAIFLIIAIFLFQVIKSQAMNPQQQVLYIPRTMNLWSKSTSSHHKLSSSWPWKPVKGCAIMGLRVSP